MYNSIGLFNNEIVGKVCITYGKRRQDEKPIAKSWFDQSRRYTSSLSYSSFSLGNVIGVIISRFDLPQMVTIKKLGNVVKLNY